MRAPRRVTGHVMALAKGAPLPKACHHRHLLLGGKKIKDKHGKTNRMADTQSRLSTSGTSFVCGEAVRVLPTACHDHVMGSDFKKKFFTKALDCKGSRGTSKPGRDAWADTRGQGARAGGRLKMFEPSMHGEDEGRKAYPHLWA